MVSQTDSILIIGSGVFGIGTAYELALQGYKDVTVIDRSPVLPAPDAASMDINKIIRWDYGDPIYATWARECVKKFRQPEWDGIYNECGVLVVGEAGPTYWSASLNNVQKLKGNATAIKSDEHLRSIWQRNTVVPLVPQGLGGYINHEGGWATSGASVSLILEKAKALGVKVVPGQEVKTFLYSSSHGRKVSGVVAKSGRRFAAEQVIVAAGSWTASLLEDTRLPIEKDLVLASGQAVAIIQLTPEEHARYAGAKVVINMANGFYMFPPTPTGEVKMVFHKPGYTNVPRGKKESAPRTILSGGGEDGMIPKADLAELRCGLAEFYPELAKKPFSKTRLCWYADSPDNNFLIDFHPKFDNVLLATSGSGHAYKFFPDLGRAIVERLQGRLDPTLVKKWSWDSRSFKLEGSRTQESRRDLQKAVFARPTDLIARQSAL